MPRRAPVNREIVLQTYAATKSNRHTAQQLGLSEWTVLQTRREAAGKCRTCGKSSPTKHCAPCKTLMAQWQRARRVRQKATKSCILCTQPAAQKHVYCAIHVEHTRQKAAQQRIKDRQIIGEEAYLAHKRDHNRRQAYGENAVKVWHQHNGGCALCGKPYSKREIHIHHIDGNHGNTRQDNLIPLCIRCHKLTHQLIAHTEPVRVIAWVERVYKIALTPRGAG